MRIKDLVSVSQLIEYYVTKILKENSAPEIAPHHYRAYARK